MVAIWDPSPWKAEDPQCRLASLELASFGVSERPALVNRMEPLRDADVNFRHTLQTCTFMYTHTEALCPLKERTERIKGFC